ncbi:MAG: maturation of Asn-linked oligosaccharides protein [Chaenotheca gracillima]|nr:MAG: maturation of Asn-linked oligosaccharides protein [Chaenotheca gracillima]
MKRSGIAPWLISYGLMLDLVSPSIAVSDQEPLQPVKKASYALGQAIPVSCLKRMIDTGEHIQDERGQLTYSPFPTCNETGRPLEFNFGVEKETNCTIDFISDEFFHLLEFYVHNDAPLTCRIPARPLTGGEREISSASSSDAEDFIPIVFSLSGTLQQSHLHIAHNLNVLLHAAPRSTLPGVIDSAVAYSTSPTTRNTRIVIGDSLPLRLSMRWYPTTNLPSGWTGVGGHLYLSTVVYCLLCIGGTAAACLAYFRAVEFPRKLRRYGAERVSGDPSGGRPGLGGYGYSGGSGYGYGVSSGRGTGKLD